MTRFEEKLYLQNVFDAIDQVYNMKKPQQISYEERLRASFNKLIVPDWYNPEYTVSNGLRKTKSHGHVPRSKLANRNNNNNNNDDTPDASISSSTYSPHLSNGTFRHSYRHRSPSRSWSEKPPVRLDSTTSSYDTSISIINGRRSASSNGSSNYAPGAQRVAQSSTWYKPRPFAAKSTNGNTNGHSNEPPKPLPRYSKIDPGRINSSDSPSLPSKIENVRCPIKPRTMAQPQIPPEESFLDVSSEADVTIVPTSPSQITNEKFPPPQVIIDNYLIPTATNLARTNSWKSLASEAESYRSARLPSNDKNLVITDSSSYASVNDRCLSPSTASFHTARAGDTSSSSSMTGYETPTPKLYDEDTTLSSHSSLSDLSHAETLEPNVEDLDLVALSTTEQKSVIIPSVDVEMENSSVPSLTNGSSNANSSSTIDSRPSENGHWYDGSLETCIHQSGSIQSDPGKIREISNDEILREIDINAVGDEFFLFSPHDTPDDNNTKTIEHAPSPIQTSNRIFTMEDKNSTGFNEFHYSSSNDPFGFDNENHTNSSSIMITNLDDILIDDENNCLNGTYRRPIQEDILYEVEHENSCSDSSQNTSSIVVVNDESSIKHDINQDYLTSTDSPIINNTQPPPSTIENEKLTNSSLTTTLHENAVLPIYILPPLYTTTATPLEPPTSLHINTIDNFPKWETAIRQYSELSSPLTYTPKIRNRQYSVGSYYDHKTSGVTLNPNYFLGSAPVSPLSRASTNSSESHFHVQHHHLSPTSYDNVSFNALRRINPFFETNTYSTIVDDHRQIFDSNSSSSSYYKTEQTKSESVERIIPTTHVESKPITLQPIASPPSTRTSFVTFPQFEAPVHRPKPTNEITTTTTTSSSSSPPPPRPPPRPALFKQESSLTRQNATYESPTSSTHPVLFKQERSSIHQNATYESPTSPIRPSLFEQEPLLVRPKTSRGHGRISPSVDEKALSKNIYQDIDSVLNNMAQHRTPNPDLQFIRDAIERVFHFNDDDDAGDATSEANSHYEEVVDGNRNDAKKSSVQYPAIEAVQRFYNHKIVSDIEQVTNLDDVNTSNSSAKQSQRKDLSKIKSSGHERASSEEIDDTLNDIEDVDYPDDKHKRQILNYSTDTSNESSPLLSSITQSKSKNTLQKSQTPIERPNASILTTEHLLNNSNPMTRITIPPIDIVTEMVIERDDITDEHVEIDQASGDMVVFYDDIEIVEHISSSCSSESESESSSESHHYSKPVNIKISQLPPPIPARTLKPVHLSSNQQQSPSTSTISYELEKFLIRKKFDVNSVNDILNRTDNNISSSVSHRHPSARHFVGKLNNDETQSVTAPPQPVIVNGNGNNKRLPTKAAYATLPSRSSSIGSKTDKNRSVIADTNALVKQIQNSLSRSSLHDTQINSKTLSSSIKDLRAFVSSTYSPSNENIIDDDGVVHIRQKTNNCEDQTFKRQARLSKSFHNVSEYKSTDQYPQNKQNYSTAKSQHPSKSVENNLDQVSQKPAKQSHIPLNLTSVITRTSSTALLNEDDGNRMLSMKWYTGQVNENSEISYNTHHIDVDDLLYGYISTHSNRETQSLFARLQGSNDPRIHAALDDIRSRVIQFDASKTREELHVFMRYLESRLRDLNNKNLSNKPTSNDEVMHVNQQSNNVQVKNTNQDIPSSRQLGRQHLRSSVSNGNGVNNHHQATSSRRSSQSSSNQENPAMFDDMLNTVLGLPKKGVSTLPQMSSSKHEKSTPLSQTQITTNTKAMNKPGRDIGKRLFESGTYKDPRLIYDGPKRIEKEEEPLETSV